jgi:hypothetical protein
VTSPALIGGSKKLITNDKGQLHFPALLPGTYLRDLATKVGIGSAPHLAHAAHSDLGSDLIRAEAGASRESHGKWPRL